MYVSIFKVVIEYKKVVGMFPLPTHLSEMTLCMTDQFFLLGLYHKDTSRPLYSYITKLYKFLLSSPAKSFCQKI